ncbi:NUDIX hydrolase [Acidiphilium acidophilum]|uniref:NUDIX domain-containing protein n=1 Tax=Acidiphilium acidophilum TaxID=76588 RepID=A0AAW9DUH6_ACIAO|nr:NUDIX domain-containing protein [Acidiphilium acidophilum]MDX5932891.1 NUDIX domain-containing protein [Acidiphilium acidophilum]
MAGGLRLRYGWGVPDLPISRIIHIAAALLIAADGRMLLVRKRGTSAFMQPGGKIGPDEDAVTALVRELREELGVAVHPAQAVYLGCFEADAANEPGHVVRAELFRVALSGTARPDAEIEEMIWVDSGVAAGVELAPLTRDYVVPMHAAQARL